MVCKENGGLQIVWGKQRCLSNSSFQNIDREDIKTKVILVKQLFLLPAATQELLSLLAQCIIITKTASKQRRSV